MHHSICPPLVLVLSMPLIPVSDVNPLSQTSPSPSALWGARPSLCAKIGKMYVIVPLQQGRGEQVGQALALVRVKRAG